MNQKNLASIDLNLLVVFDALVTEQHATRAADRVGLTQPAVSHALNRLRTVFGDPLFVRSPQGMMPTPVAVEAAPAVRSILEQIQGVLCGNKRFDPETARRQFVLGLSDYAAFVLLPRLSARLERAAPGVSLVVRNTSRGVGHGLIDEGGAELIAGNFPPPPSHIHEELLYVEDFVCAGRQGHPAFDAPLVLDRYLALRHLQVSMKGSSQGYVDSALRQQGLQRIVSVTVGHFLMAPLMVATSDLVATEPRRLFGGLGGQPPLAIAQPPVELAPFNVVQAWHARHETDPGHRWLRLQIREIASEV